MIAELVRIAERCDGVRCDMAMLPLPDVIQPTWGDRPLPADGSPPVDDLVLARSGPTRPVAATRISCSWPRSTGTANGICSSKASTTPTTSGSTTGCTRRDAAGGARPPLRRRRSFQRKSVRFLENHDEPRAASAFPPDVHRRGGRRVSRARAALLPRRRVRRPSAARLGAPQIAGRSNRSIPPCARSICAFSKS